MLVRKFTPQINILVVYSTFTHIYFTRRLKRSLAIGIFVNILVRILEISEIRLLNVVKSFKILLESLKGEQTKEMIKKQMLEIQNSIPTSGHEFATRKPSNFSMK